MPALGLQTTRNIRGMGSNTRAFSEQTERDGLAFRGAKHARLWWQTSDNEVITPGSGGVPNGVISLAWEPNADNQNANAYWNRSTRTGIIAAAGAYSGWLHVWYRRS